MFLWLAWIAKDELVYQVTGAAPAARWDEHRPRFEATAEDFHQLSQSEISKRERYQERADTTGPAGDHP